MPPVELWRVTQTGRPEVHGRDMPPWSRAVESDTDRQGLEQRWERYATSRAVESDTDRQG